MPSVEELKRQLAAAEAAEQQVVSNSTPQQSSTPVDRYVATSWGELEYDFTTPSGQLCRLKKLDLTELAEAGILDKVTRLPGVVGGVIAKAEGQPPQPESHPGEMPSRETIATVVDVVNILVPLVVVAPRIEPLPAEGEERFPGRIYVDSIEIADRIAIMNRVLGTVARLDSFRQ
jgi:hypothetical protein